VEWLQRDFLELELVEFDDFHEVHKVVSQGKADIFIPELRSI